MKKRLSLLVALLMVLTLVPFNAFAVKTTHNSVSKVGPDDKAQASITFNYEESDPVKTGVIVAKLGEDAEFVPDTTSVEVRVPQKDKNDLKISKSFDNRVTFSHDRSYMSIKVDREFKNWITTVTGAQLIIKSDVRFTAAQIGDHKWTVDATDVGFGAYDRVYAKVEEDYGQFTKRIGDVQVVGRGSCKALASVEVKVKEKGDYISLTLPSDDFKWESVMDQTTRASVYAVPVCINGRTIIYRTLEKKVVITPVIEVSKDAPLGEIEIEVGRSKGCTAGDKYDTETTFGKVEKRYEKDGYIEDEKGVKHPYKRGDIVYRYERNTNGSYKVDKNGNLVHVVDSKGNKLAVLEDLVLKRYIRKDSKCFLTDDQLEYESLVLGEYREHGLILKTVKPVKEVLVDGRDYAVEIEFQTNDRNGFAEYYDFTVDGADVWVTGLSKLVGQKWICDKTDYFDKVPDIKKTAEELAKEETEETTAVRLSKKDPKTKADADDHFTFNMYGEKKEYNKFRFWLHVKPSWDAKGDVVLKVKSKHGETAECVVLKLKPVLELKTEVKELLAGERVVDVNDVVLEETEGGALRPGQRYAISLQDMKFDFAKFESKGKLEVEGIALKNLKLDKYSQTILFTVDGRSKKDKPAKIVFKELKLVTTRSLPLGTYKLMMANVEEDPSNDRKDGEKKARLGSKDYVLNKMASKDYFKAVSELGRVRKTTVFTLGSADYTVAGEVMKLDAPVFTQDNYTMLPVRAIADALGVEVVWNQENKTATFIDGDKVVSVTVNAKTLYKNGIAYPMTTKSSVKNERMFISISSIGDAFGLNRNVDYVYDEAAKTVTIYPDATKTEKVEKVEKVKEEKK